MNLKRFRLLAFFSVTALSVTAGCGPPMAQCEPGGDGSGIQTTDEPQYLDFVLQFPGLFDNSTGDGAGDPAQIHAVIDAGVAGLISRIGATGNGKTRQLGFHYAVPIWAMEGQYPGKTAHIIQQSFQVARERNIAVHLSLETHYFWDTRPDLFNYFAPSDPSYHPNNTANVEWSDWQGTPNRHRYVNHGTPVELAPHMCYLSAKIQSEVSRLGRLIGSAVKTELDTLAAAGKSQLFSGVTVTSEPSLDNYTDIDSVDPEMGNFMAKAGEPKVRLGYCSFTALGYSAANPPPDLAAAAAAVNQKWVASWATAFAGSGIPTNRLYTHIAAAGGAPTDKPYYFLNAPIEIAFVASSRPGWTTYPVNSLTDNFDVLYGPLQANGSPHWASTEGAPLYALTVRPMAEYLGRHYNHGATVVVLNDGATGDLTNLLSQSVYGCNAIPVYQRFLSGP
ncbi:MAG TPA: hypothetical protein PKI03_02470 [Pseudomonadota bacterium]|nr:hypothetical protein [Pseudomonadota bacterium]